MPDLVQRGDDAERIGMALPAAPSLNTDDIVAFAQDAELDGLGDSPLETSVDVILPIGFVEVRLALFEQERIDSAIEVRVLQDY